MDVATDTCEEQPPWLARFSARVTEFELDYNCRCAPPPTLSAYVNDDQQHHPRVSGARTCCLTQPLIGKPLIYVQNFARGKIPVHRPAGAPALGDNQPPHLASPLVGAMGCPWHRHRLAHQLDSSAARRPACRRRRGVDCLPSQALVRIQKAQASGGVHDRVGFRPTRCYCSSYAFVSSYICESQKSVGRSTVSLLNSRTLSNTAGKFLLQDQLST